MSLWLWGRKITDGLLAEYATHLFDIGKAPGTISIVASAVKWLLKHQNGGKPVELPITSATLSGIRRAGKDRGRGQVNGLTWQEVERVCFLAEMENTLTALRDAAMIRLLYDCLLRVSEVVAVNVGDLKEKTLTLRSSESDQEGTGESLYVCDATRDMLDRYRENTDITDGAMFRTYPSR